MQFRSGKHNCLSLPALHPFLVCHVHRLGRLYPEEKKYLVSHLEMLVKNAYVEVSICNKVQS